MSLDDQDNIILPGTAPDSSRAVHSPDDAQDEEIQDFSQFAALTGTRKGKAQVSAQSIRKGEKDFEEHGTRAQLDALEQSRNVMEDVLSFTRVHKASTYVRGWYFPDALRDHVDEQVMNNQVSRGKSPQEGPKTSQGGRTSESKWPAFTRERVVVVEQDRGSLLSSMGRTVPGGRKTDPAFQRTWLLPEEALFLLERGSLDIWWPLKPLESIFPPHHEDKDGAGAEQQRDDPRKASIIAVDDYESGLPLSLQAAYALLIGEDGERSKVTLQKYQVYSNLKRSGFNVLRSAPFSQTISPATLLDHASKKNLLQWLISRVLTGNDPQARPSPPPHGPLVRPGFYRSYNDIFNQLNVIPRHKPTASAGKLESAPEEPYRVHYHFWKSGATTAFSKTRPPVPPDFELCVVDAQETSVPTLEQINALLESTPFDPPGDSLRGPGIGKLYGRLKYGYRNVLVAIVDHGVINFLRLADGAFGAEIFTDQFDGNKGPRRGKKGGAGRGRGGARGGARGS